MGVHGGEWLLAAFVVVVLAAGGACSSAEDEGGPGSTKKTTDGGTGTKKPGEDPGKDPPLTPDGAPATCVMRTEVALTVEEQRLANRLPGKNVAFAAELLEGTGFAHFETDFSKELCAEGKTPATSFDTAKALVTDAGKRLWRAAVDRVQGKTTSGTLPAGDDRMLYWARLTMTKTLRAYRPSFALTDDQRAELEWELERASRGQYDITWPKEGFVRIVLSGFDPFTLGAPGSTDDTNIRIGNPSGAAALAYDGLEIPLPNGKTARIETFTLPVNYGPFTKGMEEDTLGPLFRAGLDVAITMSQGGGYRFKIEEYNGRFHGDLEGNDNVATCMAIGALPSAPGCSIEPPERWLGYKTVPWQANQPPQFVESSLPVAAMIAANTGAKVTRPPGSQASGDNAFDVVWGYDYEIFPDCSRPRTQQLYAPVSSTYPPPENPEPPPATACARSGSGGDYLSNESAYRATLLRDVMKLTIPVGHIHTPIMTRFEAGNDSAITDAKFEAYRAAIVEQGRLLIEEVAKTL